jgi:S1-C subfamily serine protease
MAIDPSPLALLEQLSTATADAVAHASRSVVALQSVPPGRMRASGFAWRDGLIVSCDEAIPDEAALTVGLPDGSHAGATLVGRDPATDIALLRLTGASLPAVVFDAQPVRSGATALGVGRADGATVAAAGIVALAGPAWRSLRGGDIDARIELDLPLRRSAEGGLALDARGRAIGMTVFGPRRRVLVIPGPTIERVAGLLAAHGRVPRGYLGLALQAVKVEPTGFGAMVMGVAADGPGAAAGLRQGDLLLAWNGEPVQGVRRLLRALGPASVGSVVRLSLQRGGAPLEAQLIVGERPAD